MAAKNKALLEILREKYGITTLSELNTAIADLKVIDLSPFVSNGRNKTVEEEQ